MSKHTPSVSKIRSIMKWTRILGLTKFCLARERATRVLVLLGCMAVLGGAVPLLAVDAGGGYLETRITPERTAIFVDGWYMGPAGELGVPRVYSVVAGEHEVELSEPSSFGPLVFRVRIEVGRTTTISQTLQPIVSATGPFGTLKTLASDKFAGVFVDHQYKGTVGECDGFGEGLSLQPGTYTVTIILPFSGKWAQQRVRILQGQTTTVQVSL